MVSGEDDDVCLWLGGYLTAAVIVVGATLFVPPPTCFAACPMPPKDTGCNDPFFGM